MCPHTTLTLSLSYPCLVSRDDETHGPIFGGYNDLLSERQGNLFYFYTIFPYKVTDFFTFHFFRTRRAWCGRRRWRLWGQEVDLEVAELKETPDGGGQYFEHEEEEGHDEGEEGHDEGAGLDDEGVRVIGLLQDLHPHTNLGVATSFALL
jgi:hypothetical protein